MKKKTVNDVTSATDSRAPEPSQLKTRNGVPLLKVKKGSPRVTSELVHQLREDLP